jgi:hypothetical protein
MQRNSTVSNIALSNLDLRLDDHAEILTFYYAHTDILVEKEPSNLQAQSLGALIDKGMARG